MIFSFVFILLLILRAAIPALRNEAVKKAASITVLFFLFAGILASLFSYYIFNVSFRKYEALYNKTFVLEGTVTDVVWDGGYSGIYIVNVSKAGETSDFCCVLKGEGGIEENKNITCEAEFSPLTEGREFDERRYYISRNVVCNAKTESIKVTGDAGFSLSYLAKTVNRRISGVFEKYLGREGGFASALFLGNKEGLSKTLDRDFSRLGISHVLAISGMHLTVLCTFINSLLRPLGKRAGQIGSILLVVFYMFITGLSPAINRSGIMLLFLIFSSFLKFSCDGFTNLGISAFLICTVDPYSASDIGLQLSFAAVMAIFLYTQKRKELKPERVDLKKRSHISTALLGIPVSFAKDALMTVIIVLFMLPLEWYYFGQISLISPLVSPVFSMLTTLLLWALPILLILSPSPTLASLFAYPVGWLIELISKFANWLSHMRYTILSLKYDIAPIFCVLIFVCVIVFCVTKKKKRLISAAVTLALTAAFIAGTFISSIPLYNNVAVMMLSYKSSDGIMIVSENKTMIVDMGNGYSGIIDEGLWYASDLNATEVEVIMLTHIHRSHAATLENIFEENMVRTLLIPKEDSDDFDEIVEVCAENRVSVSTYVPGDTVTFGDAYIKTTEHKYIKRSVQPIIRLDIRGYEKTLTYLGGAYLESFPETTLDCDYVYLGDHGPLYKRKYTLPVEEDCLVYACENAKKFAYTEVLPGDPSMIVMEE